MAALRIFLDANVLFSAAYKDDSPVEQIWHIEAFQLLTSEYALEEARRNLERVRPAQLNRLQKLVNAMEVIGAAERIDIRDFHDLPEKDIPILYCAISSGAQYLVTGDIRHFGHLLGMMIDDVKVRTVAQLLAEINE